MLQVEDTKRALFLYGNDVSQTVKETMTDLHKLKGVSLVMRRGGVSRADSRPFLCRITQAAVQQCRGWPACWPLVSADNRCPATLLQQHE